MRQLGDKLKETALQSADSDVRVLNILSGGVHSAYTDATDLDLQRNFSIPNAANAAGFYNDLTMDRFARDDNYLHLTQESTTTTTKNANNSNNNSNTEVGAPQRGISYIHAAPGFVRTTWGKDFPLYLTLPLRLAQHFFAKSPEQCASLMVEHALLGADRRGQGFHVMGELGQAGKVTPQHSEEWRERVWEHGNEVIDRALAMN